MKKKKDKSKVFMSYSHKDERFAMGLREALKIIPGVVVLDPSSERIEGKNIADNISKMLKKSDIVITLLSPESTNNPNVLFELGMAVGLGKKVIPIAKRNTDISSIPFNIRNRKLIVAADPRSAAKKLAKHLVHLLGLRKN